MKIRFLLGIILTALLLGVCGAALYGYVSAARTGTAAIRTVAAQPAGEVAPGAPVAVAVELLVPCIRLIRIKTAAAASLKTPTSDEGTLGRYIHFLRGTLICLYKRYRMKLDNPSDCALFSPEGRAFCTAR